MELEGDWAGVSGFHDYMLRPSYLCLHLDIVYNDINDLNVLLRARW